ncbi:UDP-glucose 6-dehydrogenase [bacterium]|nr:UDP-glucose 6-dehydrogenase [bacterium]
MGIKVGIVGCGVIGGVMKKWLEENNPDCSFLISDPPKGYNDDLSQADIIFISLHIPTEEDGTQDLTLLKSIIKNLPDKPIFIRTTMLPGTCDKLSEEFNKKVYFMPEFLTERTAYEDFCRQPMIFSGETELLKSIFKGKPFIEMNNLEAEITKYSHNVFGAVKVTYFNGIYELCQKYGCDYENVKSGTLISGYINEPHTAVPGPDGKFGYGGKCFPKDVNAFTEFVKGSKLYDMLAVVKKSNEEYRK